MNPYLMSALETTPRLVEEAFGRIDVGVVDSPTDLYRFTPREIVAHLADWEPIMLGRMKQAASSPGTTILAYDEGQMALDNGYAHWDPNQSLSQYAEARTETLRWLEGLTLAEWSLTVLHPERGVQSVYDIANTLVCHDIYHVEQLMMVVRRSGAV